MLCSICCWRLSTLTGVKLRSRLLTALNLLLSMATIAWLNSLSSRHSCTKRAHTLRIPVPLSRRKSAMVLKSGASRPVSHMSCKSKLLGMSKRGDTYLRMLLIHGARSAILASKRRAKVDPWLAGLLERRHPNIAAVALANKNVRTVWALLAHDREFRPDYIPAPPAA